MTQDFLEYPRLVETAMRGVVKSALALAAQHGLPGLHHFYITFRTRDPGVAIADRLLMQYPEEMTIVLEHQFWNLEVGEDAFSVTLSFGGAQENLFIPFAAITSFVDPSVKFGLQFTAAETQVGSSSEPQDKSESADIPEKPGDEAAPPADGEAEVVALDKFRKK